MNYWTLKVQDHLSQADLCKSTGDDVAKAFNVSRSFLNGRLRGEGTCFTELKTEEQKARCLIALEENPDVRAKCLSEHCGYYGEQSLTRAFQSWFGVTFTQAKQNPGLIL